MISNYLRIKKCFRRCLQIHIERNFIFSALKNFAIFRYLQNGFETNSNYESVLLEKTDELRRNSLESWLESFFNNKIFLFSLARNSIKINTNTKVNINGNLYAFLVSLMTFFLGCDSSFKVCRPFFHSFSLHARLKWAGILKLEWQNETKNSLDDRNERLEAAWMWETQKYDFH